MWDSYTLNMASVQGNVKTCRVLLNSDRLKYGGFPVVLNYQLLVVKGKDRREKCSTS